MKRHNIRAERNGVSPSGGACGHQAMKPDPLYIEHEKFMVVAKKFIDEHGDLMNRLAKS